MNYKNRMKTFTFFLKKNFNCSIGLFDDYFIVSYREKTYLFKLYDYILFFEDKEFFDLSVEVNEFTIVDFFISIIPECDFEEEIK